MLHTVFNQGLNQAIELTSDVLKDVTIVKQKKVISKFFEEIATDTGKFCFGTKETMALLEAGVVDVLIVWEKLEWMRSETINKITGEKSIVYRKENDKVDSDVDVQDDVPLIDWIAEHYREFGSKLEIIQDVSPEGSQFCKGFGGIGALLRYQYALEHEENEVTDDDEEIDYFGKSNDISEDLSFM